MDWFLSAAMPVVASAFPAVALQLVGTGSDRLARRLDHPRVTGSGFVANPAELFSHCTLAIAPLLQGAGVKFKVLEALAAGVPVIGTPVACEGITEQPLLVKAAPDQFAKRLVASLREVKRDAILEAP